MGLEEKSSFEMLGLALSSKFDWGLYIISIAKTVCISIILPYGQAWNTVVMSGLVLLVASWNY